VGIQLGIKVNKQVWMNCFGAGVPSEEALYKEICQLRTRLDKMQLQQSKNRNKAYSRLLNTLQRNKKMLSAVKDGQPWAWMLYPSDDSDTCL